MDIRDELSALIVRPDDADIYGVDANQGHIRRAIMEIDRLRNRLWHAEAEINGLRALSSEVK